VLVHFLLPFVSFVQLVPTPSRASSPETPTYQPLASSSFHLPGGLIKASWRVDFRFVTSVLLSQLQVDQTAVAFPCPFALALLSTSISFLRAPF
jgi:hypothetical protein